jgi:hypothetical protein
LPDTTGPSCNLIAFGAALLKRGPASHEEVAKAKRDALRLRRSSITPQPISASRNAKQIARPLLRPLHELGSRPPIVAARFKRNNSESKGSHQRNSARIEVPPLYLPCSHHRTDIPKFQMWHHPSRVRAKTPTSRH